MHSERSNTSATFLIVDDDRAFARSAARQYRHFGRTHTVGSLAEARVALEEALWTGLVLDVSLPDGSGLEFLTRARQAAERVARSVLVCTGLPDESVIESQTHRLEANFAAKRWGPTRHQRFARRAIAADIVRDEAAELTADVAQRADLSAMQTRVLALQVAAIPRTEWPQILGVKANTIKTHIKRTCKRAEAPSLQALARPIARAVLATSPLRAPRDS